MSAPDITLFDAVPDVPPPPSLLYDDDEPEPDEELDACPVDPNHPDQIALRTRAAILLRRLSRIEADLAVQVGAEVAEIAMVQRAHAKAKAVITARQPFYIEQLDVISRLLVYPRDAKSIATGAGRLGRKSVPARIVVDDRAELIAWCKANLPTAVIPKVSEDIKLPDVAKHLLTTGEIADGTHTEASHEALSYKLNA